LVHPNDKEKCSPSANNSADQPIHHYCQSILPIVRSDSNGPDHRHIASNHTALDERDNDGDYGQHDYASASPIHGF
jgi:hypothetical protein